MPVYILLIFSWVCAIVAAPGPLSIQGLSGFDTLAGRDVQQVYEFFGYVQVEEFYIFLMHKLIVTHFAGFIAI